MQQLRGVGFSFDTSGDIDQFVQENFSCVDCDLDMQLVSRGLVYGLPWTDDVSCLSWFVLASNGSVAIPLFVDNANGSLSDAFFGSLSYNTLMSYRYDIILEDPIQNFSTLNSELIVGDVAFSWVDMISEFSFFRSYQAWVGLESVIDTFYDDYDAFVQNSVATVTSSQIYTAYQHYLVLANPSNDNISLCVSIDNPYAQVALPLSRSLIYSVARMGGLQTIGLSASLTTQTPDFLIQGYIPF